MGTIIHAEQAVVKKKFKISSSIFAAKGGEGSPAR
jgi:hypothetical protein